MQHHNIFHYRMQHACDIYRYNMIIHVYIVDIVYTEVHLFSSDTHRIKKQIPRQSAFAESNVSSGTTSQLVDEAMLQKLGLNMTSFQVTLCR